jgi:hypothetical protein
MLLELAILKNFNSGTYKAGVQLAGSLTTYFEDVPVSQAIPTSAMVIGNRVILAMPGDNPKDACVIATWPGGSPGGAEVHGNEYHDPDFEEEGMAATLVEGHRLSDIHSQPQPPATHGNDKHTVAYAAQSDFLAHKSRHEFGGADEPSLTNLLGRYIQVTFDWQTHDAWTEDHIGSGYVTWGLMQTLLGTGSTKDSVGKIYTASMGVGYWLHPGRSSANAWSLDSYVNGIADSLAWVGYFNATTPSDTVRHVGWKIINGQIYASNADGTNQTITDTGVNIASPYADRRLLILAGTDNIKFYINLALKATHTTNLPGGGTLRHVIYITNTAAASKVLRIYFATHSASSQY